MNSFTDHVYIFQILFDIQITPKFLFQHSLSVHTTSSTKQLNIWVGVSDLTPKDQFSSISWPTSLCSYSLMLRAGEETANTNFIVWFDLTLTITPQIRLFELEILPQNLKHNLYNVKNFKCFEGTGVNLTSFIVGTLSLLLNFTCLYTRRLQNFASFTFWVLKVV